MLTEPHVGIKLYFMGHLDGSDAGGYGAFLPKVSIQAINSSSIHCKTK